MNRRLMVRILCSLAAVLMVRQTAEGVTLTNNSIVTGGANLQSSPVVSPNGGCAGSVTNPWVYAFSAQFDMGAYRLTSAGNPASVLNTESFTLDLGGYGLTGNSGVTNLVTYGGWSANNPWNQATKAGAISIVNAGSIAIGGVDAHDASDGGAYAASRSGAILIGQPTGSGNGPVGNVSVDFLNSAYMDVLHYSDGGDGGAIAIYSTGSVSVAGNVSTYSAFYGSGSDVNINHRGAFSVVDVMTWQITSYYGNECSGAIACNGAYGGVPPSGTFQARNLYTYHGLGSGGTASRTAGGSMSIQGYTGVRVTGNIGSYHNGGGPYGYAGNITITNINGDIQVDGTVSAQASPGASYRGTLTMTASGRIQLASLDLSLFKTAVLSATGKTYVVGALANFPTNAPGSGLLDATNGLTIGYNSAIATNAYLVGGTYALKSGGQLMPMPAVDVSAGASGVTVTEADLNGTLGTSAVPANVTLYWGTNSSSWSFSTNLGVRSPGSVSTHVTGLMTNTVYYYAFQATNSDFPAGPPIVSAPFTTLIDVSAWTRRMKISLNGYNRSEVLTNFPLAVVLNQSLPGFLYSSFAATNGYDLRFYNAGLMRELNYEIEGPWNPSGNTVAWVQIDKLSSSNGYFWAYWKNPAATNAPPAYTTNGATWSPNYVGVWHMNQTNALDSSTNRFTSTVTGTVTQMVNGAVGQANGVTGNNYISVPYNPAFNMPGDYSVGAWIWPSSTSDQGILGTYSTGFILALYQGYLQFYDGSGWRSSGVSASSLLNGWQYVVYTRSGTVNKFCINGANVTTLGTGAGVTGGGALTFGRANTWGNNNYSGPLDEVRIVTAACSTNWVWAEYMNMTSNQAFQTYNTVESIQASAPTIVNSGAFNVLTNTADLVANLSSGIAPVTVTCYWGTNDGGATASSWMTNAPSSQATPPVFVTNTVTGLTAGKTYYFRYFASNAIDTAWTPVTAVFVTPGTPTVDNLPPVSLSPTSERLQGEVLGGGPNPDTWVYWGTNDGGTVKGNWSLPPIDLGARGAGSFGADVANLTANQTYWYRCYVTNAFNGGSEAWAPTSRAFTTDLPSLTIAGTGVLEGNAGTTTTAVFTVTLSAVSALPVSVDWATSNGTALVSDNDYTETNGTVTIPAGALTGGVSVTVVGDNKFETNEVFFVNLANPVNATISAGLGSCIITNDDFTLYIRGDGQGSDTNDGGTWAHAFATIPKAMTVIPYARSGRANIPASVPCRINVQASIGPQAYVGASINVAQALDLDFEGGWTDVDGATPVQGGVSVVTNGTAGISLAGAYHSNWRRVVVSRFTFTNVTRGIEVITSGADDAADIYLAVSNTTVYARNDGVYVSYPKGYSIAGGNGGHAQVTAVNLDSRAGLGGIGDGLHIEGSWMGSRVTADGVDPVTAVPRVSTILSLNGNGVFLTCPNNNEVCSAGFANTVIYGCASNGLHLDVAYYTNAAPYQVQATFLNCTIADNGANGLDMLSQTAGSWAAITNCIFSGNGGHAVSLNSTNNSFACPEDYNVLFGNDLWVNGAVQPAGTNFNTSTADPLFYKGGAKPNPWYLITSKASPAYYGSDRRRRGAYQTDKIAAGMLLIIN